MAIPYPSIFGGFQSLIEEAVLVSPQPAILSTMASKETWEEALTKKAMEDGAPLEKIRNRSSHNRGRPFAKPQIFDIDLKERAKDGLGRLGTLAQKRNSLQATVKIEGLLSKGRELWQGR